MNSERIIELLESRPFRPFTLVLGLEMDWQIDDPKFPKVHDDGETLIVDDRRSTSTERWQRWIDLKLVSAVLA